MDKEFFLNAGMPQFDHSFASAIMPSWQPLSSPMEIPMASSSTATSNDNFIIRELIGKLGNICNSGETTSTAPPSLPPYIGGGTGGGGGGCTTHFQFMNQLVKESFPCLGNLPAMPEDRGFAERAARFSSFGSRSFNDRTNQFEANNCNPEICCRSNVNLEVSDKLQRVYSSPSLKMAGSKAENNINEKKQMGNCGLDQGELPNSREHSSASAQNLGSESATNRKRKAAPKGKAKENQPPFPNNSSKGLENGEDSNAKRSRSEEGSGEEDAKTEENRGDGSKKQSNSDQKLPEPPKDYIHVRARRGQATDSHSLAERVRREKISERMKMLQDLVPGCNKVTGKALMLDEIINYVQSLQRQVEFLSMKLATVNPSLDFNMDNILSKDVIQPSCSLPHPMYPLDSLAPTPYGQPHQNHLQNSLTTGGTMDPLNHTLNPNHALQLPSVDGFSIGVPQLQALCEGDLQSIVQMGYCRKENEIQSQPSYGINQKTLMKIEF